MLVTEVGAGAKEGVGKGVRRSSRNWSAASASPKSTSIFNSLILALLKNAELKAATLATSLLCKLILGSLIARTLASASARNLARFETVASRAAFLPWRFLEDVVGAVVAQTTGCALSLLILRPWPNCTKAFHSLG